MCPLEQIFVRNATVLGHLVLDVLELQPDLRPGVDGPCKIVLVHKRCDAVKQIGGDGCAEDLMGLQVKDVA